MKKTYEEPEFLLTAFSFENILEEPRMTGSEGEGQAAADGW